MNYEAVTAAIGAIGGGLAAGIAVWSKMRSAISVEKADRAVNNAEVAILDKWKSEAQEWEDRYLALDEEKDALAVESAMKDSQISNLKYIINEMQKCQKS